MQLDRRHLLRWALAAAATGGAAAPARADRAAVLSPEERAWVAAHPIILFAPERDFPPFSYVDEQGRHRGWSADVLDLLQERTGLKFQAAAAGDRATNLERIRHREIDLLTSLRAVTERETYLGFTSPYASSQVVTIRRRSDARPGELEQLASGERVAVARNSGSNEYLHDQAPHAEPVFVDSASQVLHDVAFGEAEAGICNVATAAFLIDRDHVAGLRIAAELPYWTTLGLGYRKDWPLLGRVLEKGLATITEKEHDAIAARWNPLSDIAWWLRPEVQRVLGVASVATGLLMGGLLLWNRTLRRAVAQRTQALQLELAERHRLEERLRGLAEYDALTGLLNRAALTEGLRHALALAARQKWQVVVMFIDLDGFKAINDTHGHAVGDEVLRQVAQRLSGCLRESDLLGRLGGDEFIVVAEALQDGPRNAMELADKLMLQMQRPFLVEGRSLATGFSAGLALYPADGTSPEVLIAHADTAMYQAKQRGRLRAVLYEAPAGGEESQPTAQATDEPTVPA